MNETPTGASVACGDASCAWRAVFFDLDGTLLPMEVDEFMDAYMSSLGGYAVRHGADPVAFKKGMKAGIASMARHDVGITNEQAFFQGFLPQVEGDAAWWGKIFSDYYETEFPAIGARVTANPAAARATRTLARKGYALVLTTMPMFPLAAVRARLRWAGVDPDLFSRITTFDNSRNVKPALSYYAESLAACDMLGSEVLVVGNNTVEDLSALNMGADGYLVTDYLLDAVDFDLDTVRHGSLEEFADWVETLPSCCNPVRDVNDGLVEFGEARRALRESVGPTCSDEELELMCASCEINEQGLPVSSSAAARKKEV